MSSAEPLTDGVTAPDGFRAAGLACGIKKNGKPDLALLFSASPCAAAGVFTQNRFSAAPVRLTARHLLSGSTRAVLVNSGNANACTGRQGERDALEMASLAARALGVPRRSVCVASTGVIGEPLPLAKIRGALPRLASRLSRDGGHDAAEAILTTDTRTKEIALRGELAGGEITLGGMAKGAGMIHPNMATLLGFITTDAAVTPETLRRALREAVEESFNRISVDGDTSTNDMVLLLANGCSGRSVPNKGKDYRVFLGLLSALCIDLARKVVEDGEGATKRVTLKVEGARSRSEASRIASAIVRSPLVKTAFFGEDANWGRIFAAMGASGVDLDPSRVDLYVEKVPLVLRGVGLGGEAEEAAAKRFKEKAFQITLKLGRGKAAVTYWTCDLSLDYVRINADYRS
ncbi:MAG TPA: bifunctional glutamate N-acetyltransferase/amino-acid acetyltransferase ArgJ [Nitrospiria bacterium]|nr:bifunctional glutamate N-acetyltransferase/amino-acid acetyltransferase ArgJ [Nitrospiria bacterium]